MKQSSIRKIERNLIVVLLLLYSIYSLEMLADKKINMIQLSSMTIILIVGIICAYYKGKKIQENRI